MKIQIDGVDLFELKDIHKNVIKNDIHADIFDEDMKRRLFHVINHKYEQCFKRLKKEWEPKLASRGVTSIPLDKDEFANLVFAQEDYMDKKARVEAETPIVK